MDGVPQEKVEEKVGRVSCAGYEREGKESIIVRLNEEYLEKVKELR